jgi:1-acyl-sn-glycerol-3-phosphate acyltransferase
MGLLQSDTGLSEHDIQRLTEKALSTHVPQDTFARAWHFIGRYFSPVVVGLDKLHDPPTLFVGNHALFGIDAMVFIITTYQKTGRFIRPMADKFFFETPAGEFLMKYGLVLANPRLCAALMDAGEDILVFPGGAAESTKAESEKYTLHWRQRYGFVRMAAQHGYDIMPFGLVGPDDCYHHLLEGHQLLDTWPGKLLTRWGLTEGVRDDILPPLALGLFNTPIPRPQPTFLAFGDLVEVPNYRGKNVPKGVLTSARAETAAQIESLVRDMLVLRAQSTHRNSWLRRIMLS